MQRLQIEGNGERHVGKPLYRKRRKLMFDICYRGLPKPAASGQGNTASIVLCGAECGGLVMHQVKRLKDLTGQYEWEILMRKRHRKTLAVCPSCHAEIHNSMKS